MLQPRLLSAALVAAMAVPASARAHGLFGHVHVTGYAIENLPPGELDDLFSEPGMLEAALMGATFPDTGYAPRADNVNVREYGEAAHWEPYIEGLRKHITDTYGPTFETPEERRLIAFMMGMAAHGFEDEIYDTTFDLEIMEHDPYGEMDTYVDGFFAFDNYPRMFPTADYVPYPDLLTVYGQQNIAITQDQITTQITTVLNVYVNEGFGLGFAIQTGMNQYMTYPWSYANYMNPDIPGSYHSEVRPVTRYMQALWDRLHGRYVDDALVIHAFPDAPRRLRSANHLEAGSWVTVSFGVGVDFQTVQATVEDAAGQLHPSTLRNTRWNTRMTRVVQLRPNADFTSGGQYKVRIASGMSRIDGTVVNRAFEVPFQVECNPPDAAVCPAIVVNDPAIDGSGYPMPPPTTTDGGCSAAPNRSGGGELPKLAGGLAVGAVAFARLRRARRRS